ncbi:hypothetical protein J4477_01950 [Candidatus Pacearchaeota archaeon]|nr:hypothetical protein [Candidatus Pacearchaeota archaeon]
MSSERNEKSKGYFVNYQPMGFNYIATFASALSSAACIIHYHEGKLENLALSGVLGLTFGILQFINPYKNGKI